MAWFQRLRRRLKNLSSDGDYAGSHGGGGDSARHGRNAKAQFETHANRPDRFGGGSASGFGGGSGG
jgi:hypothetical protein